METRVKKKPRGGSRKGRPNKFTASAKEAFQLAFDQLGGPRALGEWAKENQTEFYKLFARLIPVDVQSGGEPIITKAVVEIVSPKNADAKA